MTRLEQVFNDLTHLTGLDDNPLGVRDKATELAESLRSLLEVDPMVGEEQCFYCEGEMIIGTKIVLCKRCNKNEYAGDYQFVHADDCPWKINYDKWMTND